MERIFMKNKKIIVVSLLFATAISGCATSSPMPEERYKQFSLVAVGAEKCLSEGYITPKLYSDTKDAYRTVLRTWDYDDKKMTNMIYEMNRTLPTPNAKDCRGFEAVAYQMISSANQHIENKKEERRSTEEAIKQFNNSIQQFNNSIPKPIYCNKIGTMTMCN